MSRNKSVQLAKRSKKSQRRDKKKIHQAKRRSKRSHKQDANRALNMFFGKGDIFSDYQFHGNIKWSPMDLCKLALLFSFSEKNVLPTLSPKH